MDKLDKIVLFLVFTALSIFSISAYLVYDALDKNVRKNIVCALDPKSKDCIKFYE